MRTLILEASMPTGQRNPDRAKIQRKKIAKALRTLGLSASIVDDRLRIHTNEENFFFRDKNLVRSIITELLGLEIVKVSTE